MKRLWKLFVLFFILAISLCACKTTEESNSQENDVTLESSVETTTETTTEATTGTVSESGNENLTYLTAKELYDFALLRSDWTESQLQGVGLLKEVNNLSGETIYSNEFIKYIFLNSDTPIAVTIYGQGDIEEPRGISVGDSFEDVLALFPQEKDWEKSTYGEFYGQIYESDNHEPTGDVSGYNGEKMITLSTEEVYPFLQIYFQNGLVDHYTIFLIDAS